MNQQLSLFEEMQGQRYERRMFGLAYYIHKGREQWRPFQRFRRIVKGKNKGDFEIIFVNGRRKIVKEYQIKFFPDVEEKLLDK
jgi:hypothetical protein